jgi:ribosomal protein L11 methyltransferase
MLRTVPALTIHFAPQEGNDERGLISARLSDFSTAAIHEVSDVEWRVFFRRASDRDAAATILARDHEVESIDVADEDWARKSQQNLRAIRVGAIVIAPPWDVPAENRQASSPQDQGGRSETGDAPLVIVVEPSTGFGTGHHATTRLCLRAMQSLDLRGTRVIDVGTGSGVLAIAAALRGAATVIAVDNDPDALHAARDNIQRNGATIDLRLGDIERLSLPRADLVLANLTGAMLRRNAVGIASFAAGGRVIASGFLNDESEEVERAFRPLTASSDRADEDGWSALLLHIRSGRC